MLTYTGMQSNCKARTFECSTKSFTPPLLQRPSQCSKRCVCVCVCIHTYIYIKRYMYMYMYIVSLSYTQQKKISTHTHTHTHTHTGSIAIRHVPPRLPSADKKVACQSCRCDSKVSQKVSKVESGRPGVRRTKIAYALYVDVC